MYARIEKGFIEHRLHNIDFLRGIGAFSVLIWHYQHFFFLNAGEIPPPSLDHSTQPLYVFFAIFYDHGLKAVQFFWTISGFVFFYVYRFKNTISIEEFALARFARLYPLHFITLIIVAIEQICSMSLLEKFEIYRINDIRHFILNVFMASQWGLQYSANMYSFNGPIWSVSLEILVYMQFYVIMKAFNINIISALLFLVWALILKFSAPSWLSDCTVFFALGGVSQRISLGLASFKLTIFGIFFSGFVILLSIGLYSNSNKIYYILFPSLLIFATSVEKFGFSTKKIGDYVGCITYSSYLIHVPLQIFILIICDYFNFSHEIFKKVSFFVIYIILIIGLSIFVYFYFEIPSQKRVLYLGRRLLRAHRLERGA